ncbi:MAG: GNAT family N-acetyltransferase [Candidatus Pacebacteria bacterium]|nr:GNAT family N-acetyltransferase [Candidatus Paceibacterota bacterium]MBP9851936.1 GNAT family N-acetyltransferase [Candidatus Paceibacterota bacterium]
MQTNAITIGRLSPDLWEMYRDFRFEAVQNTPEAFAVSYEEEFRKTEEQWRKQIVNMLFAQSDDKLIGMIGFYSEELEKLSHVASIVSFYVTPSARGQKVGKQLMDACLSAIRDNPKVRKVALHVTASRLEAIALYKKFQFEIIGTSREEYFSDGRYYDQHSMELFIKH